MQSKSKGNIWQVFSRDSLPPVWDSYYSKSSKTALVSTHAGMSLGREGKFTRQKLTVGFDTNMARTANCLAAASRAIPLGEIKSASARNVLIV